MRGRLALHPEIPEPLGEAVAKEFFPELIDERPRRERVIVGDQPVRQVQAIRAAGCRAGVALNPGTPAEALAPLLDEVALPATRHEVPFKAGNLPSGVYLYVLRTPERSEAGRMVLVR